MTSQNSNAGVAIDQSGTTGNLVEGNFIGAAVNGVGALANGNHGVFIFGGASSNTIGGTVAASLNVISANATAGGTWAGVDISGSGTSSNVVEGNDIGTVYGGTAFLGNGSAGVEIADSASGNTIGGTSSAAANVISGNAGDGVLITTGASDNAIQGNRIGTDVTGTTGLPNRGDGVAIVDASMGNTIGGTTAGAGNVIAFNAGNGVTVGINDTDTSAGDSILENSIFSNDKLGIDLWDDGVTLNDSSGHSGPNLFQDFPVLTSVLTTGGTTTITGTITGKPGEAYRIELFSNPAADPSGYGQGQTYLTYAEVTVGASGGATFTVQTPNTVPTGQVVTATATDPSGDTSEFSPDSVGFSIRINKLGLARNVKTGFWTGNITLTNTGSSALSGPIFILFDLPPGDVLENATGTYDGMAYLEVNVTSLAAGATTSAITVVFNADVDPSSYSTSYCLGSLPS